MRSPTSHRQGKMWRSAFAMLLLAALMMLAGCGAEGEGGTVTGGPSTTVGFAIEILPGDICTNGGQQIDYGIDDDADGILDPEEIDGSALICNGTDGATGATGGTGSAGFNALTEITDELPGSNCTFGGLRVDVGLDDGTPAGIARDGVLQTEEFDNTLYICGTGSGISEGTPATPVLLGVNEPYHATVASGGQSYYRFVAGLNWSHQIGLLLTDSDLGWTLYSDATYTTTVLAICDAHLGYDGDEQCVTPTLTSGATYYLKVEERSNIPNLFDLSVAEDEYLLAADYDGRLFRIDPETASMTLLADTGIIDLRALVFDPATTHVYAGLGWDGVCTSGWADCMLNLDPVDWSAVEILPSGWIDNVSDLSIDPTDGTLYGFNPTECDFMFTIDPVTGSQVTVGGGPDCVGPDAALTFDGSGALSFFQDSMLYEMDPLTGDVTALGGFAASGFPRTATINSLTVRSSDGQAFATTTEGDLAKVDLCRRQLTRVGTFDRPLNGLASIGGRLPAPSAPCLSANLRSGEVILNSRSYPLASALTLYWSDQPGINPADSNSYLGTVPSVVFPYTHTGLTNGQPYYYRLAATVGVKTPLSQELKAVPRAEIVFYDFDDGTTQGWTGGAGTAGGTWGLDTQLAHSGASSLSESPGGLAYAPNENTSITSPVSDFSAFTTLQLTFWQYCYWWGELGYVDVSSDAGATWTEVAAFDAYDPSWREVKLDLTPYISSQVMVRFRFTSDGVTQYWGWFIDDVLLAPRPS